MKKLLFLMIIVLSFSTHAQELQTLFGKGKSSGCYGVLSNKFTTIGGDYANISEVYGGWLVNKRFMLGVGMAASTNDIRVPLQYSTTPAFNMTYQYGQAGLMMEYILWSNRAVHFTFQMFSGAGFTLQYQRFRSLNQYDYYTARDIHDENWFFVLEPGAQIELNLTRWMRLSPGVSFRHAYGSNGLGVSDNDLSNVSYNVGLKFGKFW